MRRSRAPRPYLRRCAVPARGPIRAAAKDLVPWRWTAAMNLDELVIYDGRLYFVRGVDPAGAFEPRAYLEDAETRERLIVPLDAFREGRRLLYGATRPHE